MDVLCRFVYCAVSCDVTALGDADGDGGQQVSPWRSWQTWGGLAAVCVVYGLAFFVPLARGTHPSPIKMRNETIYMVRVAAAMRGDSLGNPYLAGHDNAPKYMPEMTERALGFIGSALHVSAIAIVAAMRVVQPALIFLLVVTIAWRLGLPPLLGTFAGILTTLAPSSAHFAWNSGGEPGYLRYLRFLSPGSHVIVFLAAVLALCWCWRRPALRNAVIAGACLGLTFHLAVFYWSVGWAGAALMAIVNRGRERRMLAIAAGIAALFAIPVAVTSIHNSQDPAVQQTLHRRPALMLLPGRRPEEATVPVALAAFFIVAFAARRLSLTLRFLAPFFAVAIPLALESLVTNRQIQANHFIDPLLPLAAIAVTGIVFEMRLPNRLAVAASVLLLVLGAARVAVDELRLEQLVNSEPQAWDLSRAMPHTLAALQAMTPAGSVVLSSPEVMEILPIFTHNKVYYANYAGQHVVTDAEIEQRRDEATHQRGSSLSFPVDYVVVIGEGCESAPDDVLFRGPAEHTCIIRNMNRR